MTAPATDKKGFNDHPYIAGFNGQKIELYAPSLAAAKQKAVNHFRPKKKDLGLVWVELANDSAKEEAAYQN